MTDTDDLRRELSVLRMELDAHKRDHRCSIQVCKIASSMQMMINRLAMKLSELRSRKRD